MHWATQLIGEPWTPEHNCWWLVRQAVLLRWGDELPDIPVGSDDSEQQITALRSASAVGRWRRADSFELDGDIVVGRVGKQRHVGFLTAVGPRLMLLHTDQHMTGAAVAQRLDEAMHMGLREIELWRRHGGG